MRITLNLATRPFADIAPALKRLRIAIGVLAVLAIAFGLGLHALHQKAEVARARDHSLDGAIARINQERQGYQDLMRRSDNALLTQTATLNRLFDEKAFSWTLAMQNLETVLPAGVQVTSIEPVRAKDGHITLHLRVVGPRDRAVELVRNLEHSRRFLLPSIVGETSESSSSGGPNQHLEPVSASNRFNFDLLADYNPPSPEERKPAKSTAKGTEKKPSPSTANSEIRPVRPHTVPVLTRQPGRPPYSGISQPPPVRPAPSPQLKPHPTPGGPR
jgi:type IV pilus assembly protein PilN